MKDTYDILDELKSFALGLNGEDHVDEVIKKCPCDTCKVVNWIVNKQKEITAKTEGEK